ncbi:MAG: hypothetical protein V4631_05230 [Pseudomonadota bacterium]
MTDIRFQSLSATEQANLPVTFGQVFAVGNVSSAQSLTGRLADGSTVPLQVNVKARHADGSLRHAVITAKLPKLGASQTLVMALASVPAPAAPAAVAPTALLDGGFTAAVNVDLNGQRYTASADALLRSGKYTTWLAGPLTNEWLVSAPLTTASGVAHPHLTARFAIRAVSGVKQARVDVTLENTWAFEANPQNFTYNAQIVVGGQTTYTKTGLAHVHHTRWRKLAWYGAEPSVHIRHNVSYLLGTKALPNFDRRVTFSEATLASMKTGWTGSGTEPMGTGMAVSYMPGTGGRPDIGLLPGWAATYLLSMDKRAKDVTLATADLAGSYSSHYRNKESDRPVSIVDFPYMTVLGQRSDTYNPVTKKLEAFPQCTVSTEACATPHTHDSSHQPAFAYLPYLVTGDNYYLEELQFWSMSNVFQGNPGYRGAEKGLLSWDQVRGQAWSMRTLAEAAYITPDADPLKSHFEGFLNNNLVNYDTSYVKTPPNNYGVLTGGAIVYNGDTGVAPWQDDFFTSAIGHTVELGYSKAKPLLAWKSLFPIGRMTAKDVCWISGAIYSLKIRDTASSPLYATLGEAFKVSTVDLAGMPCAGTAMATALKLKVGEMTGYSDTVTGFPSNMQPALAYAADSSGAAGAAAWTVFSNRSVKPDYSLGPQFSIVPR